MRTIGGVRNSDWQFSKRLIPTIQNPLANLDTRDNGDLDGGFPVSISKSRIVDSRFVGKLCGSTVATRLISV
jgi:hypothetical protein